MQNLKNTLYYIAGYEDVASCRDVVTQPSALSKIEYVKSAIKQAGFNVFLFSSAEGDQNCNLKLPEIKFVDENETIFYPMVIKRSNYLLKLISRVLLYIQIFFFILCKLDKNSPLLIYHTLQLRPIIKLMRILFNRRIYFEVEEIYNACYNNIDKIDQEIKYLKPAHGYILVNDIIKKKCNFSNESITCYGSYQYSSMERCRPQTKINIVYAGLIDSYGSDAYLAVEVAKYLSNKYHIYILGYGTPENISNLKKYIASSNSRGACSVSYEGCLSGSEYFQFLSKCDIGLCTRVLDDGLSDYTFPSKVLVYISNGIIPVCTPLTCIQTSEIGGHVIYSNNASAESISEAILNVDFSLRERYEGLLSHLHMKFVSGLSDLI